MAYTNSGFDHYDHPNTIPSLGIPNHRPLLGMLYLWVYLIMGLFMGLYIYMYGPYSLFIYNLWVYIYSVYIYIYYFTLYKTIQDRCLPTCKLVCKQSN